MYSIDELRREIDVIDEELARLLAKRLELCRLLSRVKEGLGLQLVDKARERQVVENWVRRLGEFGVSEDLAREFAYSIIRICTYTQSCSSRLGVRVVIVGSGRVGKTLYRALSRVADVKVMHRNESPEKADIYVLALKPTEEAFKYVETYVDIIKGSIVMDVFSVKTPFFGRFEELSKRLGFSYVSVHPLFGELIEPIGEGVIIIPSVTSGDGVRLVADLFAKSGFEVVILDKPETHDRLMAYLQVAHHLLLLTLYALLRKVGVSLDSPLLTHSLRITAKAIERIVRHIDVVDEIQMLNPYAKEAREEAMRMLEALIKLASEGRLREVVVR